MVFRPYSSVCLTQKYTLENWSNRLSHLHDSICGALSQETKLLGDFFRSQKRAKKSKHKDDMVIEEPSLYLWSFETVSANGSSVMKYRSENNRDLMKENSGCILRKQKAKPPTLPRLIIGKQTESSSMFMVESDRRLEGQRITEVRSGEQVSEKVRTN